MQGTAWYTKLKYGPMVEFGNLLNYTAMGVGNHDFDDSVDGLVPFAEQVEDYEKVEQTYLLPNLDQLSAAWSQHQLQPAQLHREQPLQQGETSHWSSP